MRMVLPLAEGFLDIFVLQHAFVDGDLLATFDLDNTRRRSQYNNDLSYPARSNPGPSAVDEPPG